MKRSFNLVNNSSESKDIHLFNNFSNYPFNGYEPGLPIFIISESEMPGYYNLKNEWNGGVMINHFKVTFPKLSLHRPTWEVTMYNSATGSTAQYPLATTFPTSPTTFVTVHMPSNSECVVEYEVTEQNELLAEPEPATVNSQNGVRPESSGPDCEQNQDNTSKITYLKINRKLLDQLMNSIQYINPSREVSLAYTSLQRGFSWLGEALKQTGSKSPYVESENPVSEKIEPQADHEPSNTLLNEFGDIENTQTARVKLFRAKLSNYISGLENFCNMSESCGNISESCGKEFNECLKESLKAVREAKIWFGWELGRIRKEKERLANMPETTAPHKPLPL